MCNFRYTKQGNITVVNEGLFYFGPNTGVMWFNIFLIVLFTGLAWGPPSPHPAATAVGVVWGVVCLYFLFRTGCTDPGIIPRQPKPTDLPPERITRPGLGIAGERNTPVVEVPNNREIQVECKHPVSGKIIPKKMELSWCYTCNIQRPLRASHCRWCDCCIENMDHHCPWTSTCVGKRNYRFFFGFVVSVTLYCLFMIACMIASIVIAVRLGKSRGKQGTEAFNEGMKEQYYLSIPVLITAIVVFFMVSGLSCFHCSLVARNETTHESLRRYYHQLRTPFDQGSCCNNCTAVLCPDEPDPCVMEKTAASPQLANGGGGDGINFGTASSSTQNQNQNPVSRAPAQASPSAQHIAVNLERPER